MSISPPNLDDRDFEALLQEAKRYIQRACPQWTDLSPSDPGMVLLEVFAHLTEVMIYRLNRLPDKAYIEFLRLIGVRLYPPAAASAELRFSLGAALDQPIIIPRGTRVGAQKAEGAGEAPTFVTAKSVTIPAGEADVAVTAYHCDLVEGELAGVGTGLPGLVVRAQRPPIISTGDELDLVIGVETEAQDRQTQVPVIEFEGTPYRVWREVESFANLGTDGFVYLADRLSGTITFAPAARRLRERELEAVPHALAEVPGAGREIRLWYRRGGGANGNVAAGALTVLKDPIPGVEVSNPQPASGGRAAETLENALIRGPQELHSLQRAVTARDFELMARLSSRAVARAKAFTSAELWSYALPGTAEVLLVPHVPEQEYAGNKIPMEVLKARASDLVRTQIVRVLEERRPLGTRCSVYWANYKTVKVSARIVVGRHEERTAVKARVLKRLHQTISPLPTSLSPSGWPFGQALRASHVYDIALAEPGVLWADRVMFRVDMVPNRPVRSVETDAFQPRTWYAGSGPALFRSLNGGESWEVTGVFTDEMINCVRAHPERAGHLAAVTSMADSGGSRVHLSSDCGETWRTAVATAFAVRDAAWLVRDGASTLLLATDTGLYELALAEDSSLVQVLVAPRDVDLGFYAVAASRGARGQASVAVAAQGVNGVFLSSDGGRSGSFRRIDNVAQGKAITGEDVRVLDVQYDGPRSFLWAGVTAAGGDDPGEGCFRWELRGSEDPPEGWRPFGNGWQGGSCWSLAFLGTRVMAGSHRAGVLQLDTQEKTPTWIAPDRNCGLPLESAGRFEFQPIDTVAVDPKTRSVMAGGAKGVFRSSDEGVSYRSVSNDTFADKVALPPTWLFCSGEHDIVVVSEDEAE